MAITYDPAKRKWTLANRELDFEDAAKVIADPRQQTAEDTREDYGETRFVTVGYLRGRMVVLAWTPRGLSSGLSRRMRPFAFPAPPLD